MPLRAKVRYLADPKLELHFYQYIILHINRNMAI